MRPDDWLLHWPEAQNTENSPIQPDSEPQPGPSTSTEVPPEINAGNGSAELDTEILEILGDDPSSTQKFGPEIHSEVANRLLHLARDGLQKEVRKDLITKYPVPANCVQIDAPKINPEIKAALVDTAIKRDKGIETKQKQMTSAIACLSGIINTQINAIPKNNELLQKLMDICRILCDIQHADSITRRNFILFALKNDMKEHLKNTKIDSFLFGDNLAETLKSAKAVNKSGVELKADTINKSNTRFRGTGPRPLNRKPPPPARRPPAGTAPPAPRSREPAAVRAPYHPPAYQHHQPPRGHTSKTSSQAQQAAYPRRQY